MPLKSGLFHSCITSPPYYGLRKYAGYQEVVWPTLISSYLGHEHEWKYSPRRNPNASGGWQGGAEGGLARPGTEVADYETREIPGSICKICGAWKGALGAEPTPEMYVEHFVVVAKEIKRVLRPDGTFWLNIADSYDPKGNLIGVPWMLAFALKKDGWILRNDVVWSKHSMPEPRKGWRHEQEACPCVTERREKHIQIQMAEQGVERHRVYDKAGTKFKPDPDCPICHGSGRHGEMKFIPESWRHTRAHEYFFQFSKAMHYYSDHTRAATETGANPRSVMSPQRTNYSGKHFAVYPPDLIAPLIQSSVPKMCCNECGNPWAPVIERIRGEEIASVSPGEEVNPNKGGATYRPTIRAEVTGYHPTCYHQIDPVPGIVLDPFMGSGTTGMVAKEFGVNYIGLDISLEYLDEQAKIRTKSGQPSNALKGLPLFDAE